MENDEVMQVLTRESILNAQDIETVFFPVHEWGGGTYLKAFDGRDRDKFEEYITNKKGGKGKNANIDIKGVKALAIVRSAVDAEGSFVFTEKDIPELNRKSAKAISRLFDKFCEMNGFGEDDVDDLVGNSKGEMSDTSGSASPETSEDAQ